MEVNVGEQHCLEGLKMIKLINKKTKEWVATIHKDLGELEFSVSNDIEVEQ